MKNSARWTLCVWAIATFSASCEQLQCDPSRRGPAKVATTAPPQDAGHDLAIHQAQPPPGADYTAEFAEIYRMVACAGDDPVPEPLAATVASHCRLMNGLKDEYRNLYLEKARPFLARLPGRDGVKLPTTVIYPCGGGDLLSALTTYPDLTEVTTMSLEMAGEPRSLAQLPPARLASSLKAVRAAITGLLTSNDSTSDNLMGLQRGDIPGQLAFFATALAVHGLQPRWLRFFRIEPDGSLHYLTTEEVTLQSPDKALKLKPTWVAPDFSPAFANAEIGFSDAAGTSVKIHRHIGANLDNQHLDGTPLLHYLEARGKVCAMTKASSYLLWIEPFSTIRNLLLRQMVYMVSDSTGIPPAYLKGTAFTQIPFGRFRGSFLEASPVHNASFVELWQSQTFHPLPFRYGYLDAQHGYHLLVTMLKPGVSIAPQPARIEGR